MVKRVIWWSTFILILIFGYFFLNFKFIIRLSIARCAGFNSNEFRILLRGMQLRDRSLISWYRARRFNHICWRWSVSRQIIHSSFWHFSCFQIYHEALMLLMNWIYRLPFAYLYFIIESHTQTTQALQIYRLSRHQTCRHLIIGAKA